MRDVLAAFAPSVAPGRDPGFFSMEGTGGPVSTAIIQLAVSSVSAVASCYKQWANPLAGLISRSGPWRRNGLTRFSNWPMDRVISSRRSDFAVRTGALSVRVREANLS